MKLGTGEPPPGPASTSAAPPSRRPGRTTSSWSSRSTGVEAGCWGGLLSLGAKVRGVAGVVADGPVRDIDEAIGHDFPVFSRALTSFTARGRVVEKGTGVPVEIGARDGERRATTWSRTAAP